MNSYFLFSIWSSEQFDDDHTTMIKNRTNKHRHWHDTLYHALKNYDMIQRIWII